MTTTRTRTVRFTGADRGFTVWEVMLCMVVTALLALITVPSYKAVTANFYDRALGYDIGQVQRAAEDAMTLEQVYPASPGSNAVPAAILSRVILTSADKTTLHYAAADDGLSYVLSAWDSRTGDVFCIDTATDSKYTPVQMSMPAESGDIQCLRGFTAVQPQSVQ